MIGYAFERFLFSPTVVFFAALFAIYGATIVLRKTPKILVSHYRVRAIIGSAIAGALFLSLRIFTDFAYSPLIIIATPLLSVLVLRAISDDDFFSYLFLFMMCLCNNVCFYMISFSILSFFPRHEIVLGSMEYMFATFSITGFLLSAYEIIVAIFAGPVLKRVRTLIQSSRRGVLFFFFLLNVDIVMMLAVFFILPILEAPLMPSPVRNRIATFQMVAATLMLTGSYLVIYIQAKLEQNLELEKMYRISSQKNALLNYSYNAMTGEILEDYNIFKKEYQATPGGSKNYYDTMEVAIWEAIHPEDRDVVMAIKNDVTAMKKAIGSSYSIRARMSPTRCADIVTMTTLQERRLRLTGKEWIWVEITITVAADRSSDNLIVYVTVNDIDDTVTYENILKKTAQLDPLTGIYNRGELENRVAMYLEERYATGALIILDIDLFKQINDTYGHKTGDAVLKQLASAITTVFRSEDIIARLGGDEFCIFAKAMNSRKLLEQRIIDLKKDFQKPFTTESGEELTSTISLGAAFCPDNGATFDELYQNADEALYAAKKSGRDAWRFYADISS